MHHPSRCIQSTCSNGWNGWLDWVETVGTTGWKRLARLVETASTIGWKRLARLVETAGTAESGPSQLELCLPAGTVPSHQPSHPNGLNCLCSITHEIYKGNQLLIIYVCSSISFSVCAIWQFRYNGLDIGFWSYGKIVVIYHFDTRLYEWHTINNWHIIIYVVSSVIVLG